MESKDKILVAVDASYFMYFLAFGAVSLFQKKCPEEASSWIKDPKDVDQENLPDLLGCQSFCKILKSYVMKRCETIDDLLKANFQDELDSASRIDMLFAMDDYTSRSFRKELYPAYKAQRKLVPKAFSMSKIRNYVFNVLFKELELEEKFGYKFISVDGAEGDDIIATAFKRCADDYMLKVLIASDHDFIQLEGVKQLNLFGKEAECKLGGMEVTPDEYLLGKILLGDSSDNISKVLKGVGPKKALKLVKDKASLKKLLVEDASAAKQFILNRKLMSFDEIPKDLSDKIVEHVNKALYSEEVLNKCKFDNMSWL